MLDAFSKEVKVCKAYRGRAPSVLALRDVWSARRHPPAVGAAVMGLVGAERQGTGRCRTGTESRVCAGGNAAFTQQHLLKECSNIHDMSSFNLRPSFPLVRTLAALRLRARKDRVGVISLSTMLLSHGLSARLRAAGRQRASTRVSLSFRCPEQKSLSP